MQLKVLVDGDGFAIDVPDNLIAEANEFFDGMDRDMDGGVQMSRHWVENPTKEQRCQLVAERLVNAVSRSDEPASMMMAGYILSRLPQTTTIRVDADGDVLATEFMTD